MPAGAQTISCKVVGVSDGDTLTCLTAQKTQIKVRLAQIDAPEKAQPYGQRAKSALSDYVFGKSIVLDGQETDRYGRMVATVKVGNNDINLEMVRTGMAWVYDQYARDPAYFRAQSAAQGARVGLWGDQNPVRPSEWRHGGAAVAAAPASVPVKTPGTNAGFACAGKRFCGQMTSCAEATHYLTACGLAKLDRDGDGVPCESLCR